MLLPLSRHALPVICGNGLGKLLAEPVELQLRIGELAIDNPQSLDSHSDMRRRSLNGSLSHVERRFPQLLQHLSRVETTYTMLLQNAHNSCLRCAGRLLGRRCGFPQIEHPLLIQVAEF